ncbi:MAG: hypothetical protein KF850_05565 [Labilithrix sp.]|nr:hypothetical protein [Labilithrix sp.]
MPVGTRLELVATAEVHAPRRAVIKGESYPGQGSDGKCTRCRSSFDPT